MHLNSHEDFHYLTQVKPTPASSWTQETKVEQTPENTRMQAEPTPGNACTQNEPNPGSICTVVESKPVGTRSQVETNPGSTCSQVEQTPGSRYPQAEPNPVSNCSQVEPNLGSSCTQLEQTSVSTCTQVTLLEPTPEDSSPQRKLYNVARELLKTEHDYVQRLTLLHQVNEISTVTFVNSIYKYDIFRKNIPPILSMHPLILS